MQKQSHESSQSNRAAGRPPPNHELRSQADQYLETWTQQVLELAEEVFQAGDIERSQSWQGGRSMEG